MKATQLMPRYTLKAVLILLGFLVLGPQHLWAQQQQPATCTDWAGIQSWSGTITVSGSGQATDQSGDIPERILNSRAKFNILLITHELGVPNRLLIRRPRKSLDQLS